MAGDGKQKPSSQIKVRQTGSFPVTDEQRAIFLDTLAATGSVSAASRAARPWRKYADGNVFYSIRKRDPDFEAQWTAALDQFKDSILAEAYKRGVEGETRSVWQGGRQVLNRDGTPATIRIVSDKILERLLIGRRFFGDDFVEKRSQDINVTHDAGHLLISEADALLLNKEERLALATVLRGLQRVRQDQKPEEQLLLESTAVDAEFAEVEIEEWELMTDGR
jgi:hypothetical protein